MDVVALPQIPPAAGPCPSPGQPSFAQVVGLFPETCRETGTPGSTQDPPPGAPGVPRRKPVRKCGAPDGGPAVPPYSCGAPEKAGACKGKPQPGLRVTHGPPESRALEPIPEEPAKAPVAAPERWTSRLEAALAARNPLRLELQLVPPELGRVRVVLEERHGRLRARIVVSNRLAASSLHARRDRLLEMLGDESSLDIEYGSDFLDGEDGSSPDARKQGR